MSSLWATVPAIAGSEVGVRYEHFVLGVALTVLEGELVLPTTRSQRWVNLALIASFLFVLGVVVYHSAITP